MNMREDIRNVMLAHGSPMRPCEVAKALPQYDAQRVSEAIVSGMYGEGVLSRVVREDGYRGYYASRNVKLKRHESEEARQAAKRITNAEHNRRLSAKRKAQRAEQQARAQYNARRAEEAKVRAAAKAAANAAAKLERAQQRIAERAQRAAERTEAQQAEKRALWAKRKAEQRAKKRMTTPQRIFMQPPAPTKTVTKAAPAPKPAMTVEQFLANGGEIEVLPGIQVKPLSYGGHRDMNNDSMRRSLHE